ncbi:MAG: RluA family pseudouridine synthase [Planctomycetota bacterium]
MLYIDDDLVVVDKPAGVLAVPAPGRGGKALVDLLATQLGRRVFAVHRLDEETTGCIAFALDDGVREALERTFRTHAAERTYLALLSAVPSPESGRIEANLKEAAGGVMQVVRAGGQRAVTHYRTLSRRGRCCLVECRLDTGRRNQIRVHMAALGCPLAGDRKYGFRARNGENFSRVMLHSWRLSFAHPVTAAAIDILCEPAEQELRP